MTTHMLRLQLISQDGQIEKTELIEHAQNCGLNRLRVVAHFSSEIVERAKRERA